MAAPVKGWCPVHDRVFESKDGLCPKCGTALVSDEPAERPPVVIHAEPQPDDAPQELVVKPKTDRRTLVTIAGAVLVAFLAGLAFPQGEKQAAGPVTTRDVLADLNVGVTRNVGRTGLRLESFTQRGRNVVVRFSVPTGANLDIGRLQGVRVVFILAGSGEVSDNLAPRTTVNGFIISGTFLQRGDLPVTGVRIDALEFESGEEDEARIDISGAWPATSKNQPRASGASATLRPGDGRTITVDGLVGWANRLEIGVSTRGGRPGLFYDTEFHLTGAASAHRGEVVSSMRSDDGHEGREVLTIRFDGLPRDVSLWTFGAVVGRIFAEGLWEWSFI